MISETAHFTLTASWSCWFSEQADKTSFALNHIVRDYNQQQYYVWIKLGIVKKKKKTHFSELLAWKMSWYLLKVFNFRIQSSFIEKSVMEYV